MKKIVFLLSFAFAAQAGYAQHFGIKAGPTLTTLKGAGATDYDYRLGYTGGVMLQKHLTQRVGVQAELLYTSKGAKREYTAGGNAVEDKYRLNYVDLPVMLHLSSGGIFVDAGPQISFLNKARFIRETTSGSGNTTTTVKTDITDQPYQIDFGYVAGLGYRASSGVGVELRYNGGLKKIDDEGPLVGTERRNSTILLMFSYLLPGG